MQDLPRERDNPVDDRELMLLLQTDPGAGAAALYDRYGRVVFSVALRMVGDRQIAEEVTQDVFVRCWRNASTYQATSGSVIRWLLGITHHRAIDELRSRRYQARTRETTWSEPRIERISTEDHADLHVLQAIVRDALADLPPQQREVIELLYFSGLTRQETAQRLNAPLGTIHTRLRLGFGKLRSALAPLRDDSTEQPPARHVADHHD